MEIPGISQTLCLHTNLMSCRYFRSHRELGGGYTGGDDDWGASVRTLRQWALCEVIRLYPAPSPSPSLSLVSGGLPAVLECRMLREGPAVGWKTSPWEPQRTLNGQRERKLIAEQVVEHRDGGGGGSSLGEGRDPQYHCPASAHFIASLRMLLEH